MTGCMEPCLEWERSFSKNGYGAQYVPGRGMVGAHRVSYCESHGLSLDDIAGQVVLHSCDNKRCILPSHLSLGTQLQNIQEAVDRKRFRRGSSHGISKLSESQVIDIREEYSAGGITQQALASRYGVSQTTVGKIVRGIYWSWL